MYARPESVRHVQGTLTFDGQRSRLIRHRYGRLSIEAPDPRGRSFRSVVGWHAHIVHVVATGQTSATAVHKSVQPADPPLSKP